MPSNDNDNIEIMTNNKADEVREEVSNHFFPDTKLDWRHQ